MQTLKRRRKTADSRHLQVTNSLRELILGGSVASGDLLPTIHELAAQFDTSYFTVQSALTPLVEEGLIECKRRVGTIVKHNSAVLTCAGIYCGSGLLDEWEYAFYRELCQQLRRQLSVQGVQTHLYADMRPRGQQNEALPELVEAVNNQQIQALLVPLCDGPRLQWLMRLPVATSFVSSDPIAYRVSYDSLQMLRLALGRLRDQGCREVGMISALETPRGKDSTTFKFYKEFVSMVSELGMKTRDSWGITPPEFIPDHESYGYGSFRRLWEQKERPEGLFVYPDTSARGVMTAALELGVRVPDDLKMVFHHNTGVDWLCPLAVDWVESDTARWAAEMIKEIRLQKAGVPVEPIVLEYALRLHR